MRDKGALISSVCRGMQHLKIRTGTIQELPFLSIVADSTVEPTPVQ